MSYTIGPVGQMSDDRFAFRVSCPGLTVRQFAFIAGNLEAVGSDTYPDFIRRTVLFVYGRSDCGNDGAVDTLDDMPDFVAEQVVDKFVRRCCDPRSNLFSPDLADDSPATEEELSSIMFPE